MLDCQRIIFRSSTSCMPYRLNRDLEFAPDFQCFIFRIAGGLPYSAGDAFHLTLSFWLKMCRH